MKTSRFTICLLLLLSIGIACQKDAEFTENTTKEAQSAGDLTISDAQQWLANQKEAITTSNSGTQRSFSIAAFSSSLKNAKTVNFGKRNWVLTSLPGQQKVNGLAIGYRKLLLSRNKSGAITAKILEVIPDYRTARLNSPGFKKNFTGRVFIYNEKYQLLGGNIYFEGRISGKIRPEEETKVKQVQAVESCEWQQDAYVNGQGEIVLVGQKVCDYYLYDDGIGNEYDEYDGNWGNSEAVEPPSEGGGGSSAYVPAESNLPDAEQPGIDAKKMMDCFGTLPNAGSTLKITVYVQEPFPGTTFNYGPNSVGHTAIGLTKTVGGQSITQIFGFYPADGKGNVYGGEAKLVDNSGMKFNSSVSYVIGEEGFHAAAAYISGTLPNYNIDSFNCTAFAVVAASKAGVELPSAWNTVGYSYNPMTPRPVVQCPAGLGDSIRKLPDGPNVNKDGGNIPMGKGPCN